MMSKLQRKLRSRTGASMILALLFLMFCSFVGSSVLVSATANAYRVKLYGEQQDFLDQRSAALLLSDELQVPEGQRFRLYVLDAFKTINEHKYVEQNNTTVPTGRYDEERVITFQLLTDANAQVTELQQLMLQTTIWRYLRNNAAGEPCTVVIKDKNGATMNLDSFWYSFPTVSITGNVVTIPEESTTTVGGTISVNAQLNQNVSGISSLPSYSGYYYSCGESKVADDQFDFVIDFGSESQLKLVMDGYSGTSEPITVEGIPTYGQISQPNPENYIQVTTTSTQTLISWEDPTIEKGGA